MSNNDEVTSQALYIQNCSEKEAGFSAEMRRRREGAEVIYVLWQIVPDTSSGDREGSIADGGESSSADNQ